MSCRMSIIHPSTGLAGYLLTINGIAENLLNLYLNAFHIKKFTISMVCSMKLIQVKQLRYLMK